MQKITPCLWFDDKAEEAAKFYVSIFPNSNIKHIEKYTVDTPSDKPIGSIMTVTFSINGNEFMGLNGGPFFKLSEAVSFMIECNDQKEVDYYYDKLSHDLRAEQCGWLKDKFGLSWQIIPKKFGEMMAKVESNKKKRMMTAFLKMKRINLKELEEA